MSYDLNFWCYEDEDRPRSEADHLAVYRALSDGHAVSGLKPLGWPGLKERLATRFRDWTRDGDTWTKAGVVVELSGTPVSVRFDLRGAWTGEMANDLIDIMKEHECRLFDPQAGPNGRRFGVTE